MKETDQEWADDADEWFYDFGTVRKRIQAGEKKQTRLRRRQWTAMIFFMFAFLLLSYRSEINADRIDRANAAIRVTQDVNCLSGLAILTRFNALQDRLIEIEKRNPSFNEEQRLLRIKAYEDARILPLPVCLQPRGER